MKLFFRLAIIALTVFTCGSPQKTFNKGNYDSAFKQTFKKLKKGKADKTDKSILLRSLNEINKKAIDKIDRLEKSNIIENWEAAYVLYDEVIDRNEKVFTYMPYEMDFELDFYTNKMETLRQDLVAEFTFHGVENMSKAAETGLKRIAQDAYHDFDKAIAYGGERSQLEPLREQAHAAGVLIYNVEFDTRFHQYEWEIKNTFNKLYNESSLFTNIVLDEYREDTDCNLVFQFEDIYFRYGENNNRENYSEDVITGYETVVDTSGNATEQPVYETVSATVDRTTFLKAARLDVRMYVQALTPNCDLEERYFTETIEDEAESIRVSGDERALPAGMRDSDEELETDREMADELIEELYRKVRMRF